MADQEEQARKMWEEQAKKMGSVIAKCWSDHGFKKKLLADPAATLKAEGVKFELPEGMTLKAVENNDAATMDRIRRALLVDALEFYQGFLRQKGDDPSVRRMFLEEGRIAGLVRHPHVVSVVDVGEDDAGPYLVMDFVEGVSLAEVVARTAARRQLVPMPIALRIATQVAEGLHAVHETAGPDGQPLQLIHRDISPQNVLIGFDGTARVSDFGIAKALGRATRTTTGVLKGKLGYLAPERLRFEEPDRRADLFSFGVVLFELLAGRRLYDSPDDVEGPRRGIVGPGKGAGGLHRHGQRPQSAPLAAFAPGERSP